MEEDIRWKTTFSGRRTSVEEDLQWKTTFGGRQPLVEDNFWWAWLNTHSGFLIDTKNIETQRIFWVQNYITYIFSLHAAYSALQHLFENL